MLAGRRVVLGVSGGIAAYKAVYLARRLIEAGADLRVVMTPSALRFVGAQSFAAVSGHSPHTELFGPDHVSPHTELGRWADAIVVAPATAHTLAKLAHGFSNDVLSATVAATRAPVLLAPAMHTEMWEQEVTQRNVELLQQDGFHLVGPATGALAGGDEGEGRMVEPEEIAESLNDLLSGPLEGWDVLVAAGGTREPIDPVRYVGNRSSGRMGHAIAAEAARRGANTVLVTSSVLEIPRVADIVAVDTAEEMAAEVWARAPQMDVVVMAAAVADFRPKQIHEKKLRRQEGPPDVILEPTPDILAGVAERAPDAFLIGFAAETGPAAGAASKARQKQVDLMVANDVTAEGSGFGTETNEVTILSPDGTVEPWPLMSKADVARSLWDRVVAMSAD